MGPQAAITLAGLLGLVAAAALATAWTHRHGELIRVLDGAPAEGWADGLGAIPDLPLAAAPPASDPLPARTRSPQDPVSGAAVPGLTPATAQQTPRPPCPTCR